MNVALGTPAAPHEPDRVPLRPVAVSVVALILVVLATHWAVWQLLPESHSLAAAVGPIPETPAAKDWGDAGKEQLRSLHAREDANLNSYEWLDSAHTAARIPISRAMAALAPAAEGTSP